MTVLQATAQAAPLEGFTRPPESQLRLAWRAFRRNRLAIAGAVLVILLSVLAVVAPAVTPYDFKAFNRGQPLKPPSERFWFGTDRQTRDVFSRVVVGSQVSLSVGFTAVALIMLIGVTLGAISGYAGGNVDNVIMRVTD